jgi:hypothetical protein
MQIQKLTSSKLFYNKWPYKIECLVPGAKRISYNGIDEVKKYCLGLPCKPLGYWMEKSRLSLIEKEKLHKFVNKLEPFLEIEDALQSRSEGSIYSIFCKDKVLLDNICNELHDWILMVYGPTSDEELNFLLENGHKKILRDNLPKNIYQYRIFFNESWNKEARLNFLTWTLKFTDTMHISRGSREWLAGEKRWINNPFMYVKDSQTLTMIGLFASGNIKRIEEFILRANINTICPT